MRHLSFIVLVSLLNIQTNAQLQQPVSITYTSADGLSYSEVNNIQIDHLGFIWIATNYGLNKFDGKHFIRYYSPANNINGIKGNVISEVECDSIAVWIATANNGLACYFDEPGYFYTYTHSASDSSSLVSNQVNCLHISANKKILIGTKEGLSILDRNNSRFTNIIQHPLLNTPLNITSFAESPSGVVWIGTNAQGLLFFRNNNIIAILNEPKQLLSACVNDLMYDEDKHELWVASTKGLWCVKDNAAHIPAKWQQPFYGLRGKNINCIKKDSTGAIWIGTSSDGLFKCDVAQKNISHVVVSTITGKELSSCINDIFFSPDGTTWLSTSAGIQCYNADLLRFPIFKTYIHHHNVVLPEFVHGMCLYKKYIIGAADYGVYISDTNFTKSYNLSAVDKTGNNVSFKNASVCDGKIFIESSNGIYELNLQNRTPSLFLSKIFHKLFLNDCVNIVRSNKNIFWIATQKKLYVTNINTGKTDSIQTPNIPITSLYRDTQGRMLVGGDGFAAAYNTNERLVNVLSSNLKNTQVEKGLVYDFYDDGKNIWIADCDAGLYRCNRYLQVLNVYNSENGLCNNGLLCIQPDQRGRLWLATHRGLSMFDTATKVFSNYYTQQGLPSQEFNEYGKSTSLHGTLYFSTSQGIIQIRPYTGKIIKQDSLTIQISRLLVDEKSMTENDLLFLNQFHRLSVDYGKNISLSFSAATFLPVYNYSLQYKLDNEKSWSDIESNAEILFQHLQPGNYKLYMRAVENKKNSISKTFIITIVVNTPFYRAWWFICIICLAFIYIIYSMYRYRINEIKKLYAVRAKISRDLHDDMGSTLGSISIYSEVAKNRSVKNENADEAIAKIGSASRELIDKMSDIVWSINPNNESFEQLQNRIQVFAAIMLTPHEILYNIYTDEALKRLKLTTEKRKNIYLIYKEAVHNIIKYAACTEVEIKLLLHANEFTMRIKDNGKGFNVNQIENANESLGGNGIKNMQARAESIHAHFNVHSTENGGTTIGLKLKV